MALTAQRHVHILSPDHRVAILGRRPKREAGILLAQLTNRCQLLYLLALGDQRQNVWEGSP